MMPEIHDSPPLGYPTAAQPGTKAKVEVMRSRYAMGKAIFHPADPVHEWAYNQPKRDTVSLSEMRAALRDKSHEYQDE